MPRSLVTCRGLPSGYGSSQIWVAPDSPLDSCALTSSPLPSGSHATWVTARHAGVSTTRCAPEVLSTYTTSACSRPACVPGTAIVRPSGDHAMLSSRNVSESFRRASSRAVIVFVSVSITAAPPSSGKPRTKANCNPSGEKLTMPSTSSTMRRALPPSTGTW